VVCLSVLCLSVTIVHTAKTAELIKMSFELWTRVGSRNQVLDLGPDPPCKGAILRGKWAAHCKVSELCRELCKPIEMT